MNEIKELVDIKLVERTLVDDDLKYLVDKYINNMTDLTKLKLNLFGDCIYVIMFCKLVCNNNNNN